MHYECEYYNPGISRVPQRARVRPRSPIRPPRDRTPARTRVLSLPQPQPPKTAPRELWLLLASASTPIAAGRSLGTVCRGKFAPRREGCGGRRRGRRRVGKATQHANRHRVSPNIMRFSRASSTRGERQGIHGSGDEKKKELGRDGVKRNTRIPFRG